MIALTDFLNGVQWNVDRITHYEKGGDGSGGGCDCIGLIISALRLAGEKWPGIHGSNWAARNAMDGLEHIADARNLFLGEIVFKAHEPGKKGYDLPGAYKNSPDQRDYRTQERKWFDGRGYIYSCACKGKYKHSRKAKATHPRTVYRKTIIV